MGNESKQTDQQGAGRNVNSSDFSRILLKDMNVDHEWDFFRTKVLLSDKLKIADKRYRPSCKLLTFPQLTSSSLLDMLYPQIVNDVLPKPGIISKESLTSIKEELISRGNERPERLLLP